MLPQVLMDIVDKYNEKGILILSSNGLEWFNGEKWQMWIKKIPFINFEHLRLSFFFSRNQNIYFVNCTNRREYYYFQFKSNQFFEIQKKIKPKQKLTVLKNNIKMECFIRGKMLFDHSTKKSLSKKTFQYENALVLTIKNYIFEFNYCMASRYNINDDTMHEFALPTKNNYLVFKLKNNIYRLFKNGNIAIFDPENLVWNTQFKRTNHKLKRTAWSIEF
jgi:hypothetical protein